MHWNNSSHNNDKSVAKRIPQDFRLSRRFIIMFSFHRMSLLATFIIIMVKCVFVPIAFSDWDGDGVYVSGTMWVFDLVPGPDNTTYVVYEEIVGMDIYKIYVQRYSEDGNPMFPGHGVQVTDPDLDHLHFLYGALPVSNGDVMINFGSPTIDPEFGNNLYGQRISPMGVRVFGEEGAPVSVEPGWKEPWSFPAIFTDGNDGFWTYHETDELRLCGLNSDGTQKFEESIFITDDVDDHGVSVCRDGEGGAFVIWGVDIGIPNITRGQRISSEGELLWQDQYLISEMFVSRQTHIKYFPGGGFYSVHGGGGTNSFSLNRYNSAGIMSWEEEARDFLPVRAMYISQMVVMLDSSVAVLASIDAEIPKLIRVNPDGSPYYGDQYFTELDTSINNFQIQPSPALVRTVDGESLYSFCAINCGPFGASNIRVNLIQPEGTDAWDDKIVYVSENLTRQLNWIDVALNQDKSIVLGTRSQTVGSSLYLYKVYEDGTVAGHTSAVTELGQAIPNNIIIQNSYPNPFNSSVTIEIESLINMEVKTQVYNLLGKVIHTASYNLSTGLNRLEWKPEKNTPSGIYFINFKHKEITQQNQKVVLLK